MTKTSESSCTHIFFYLFIKENFKGARILTWIHGGGLPQARCWRSLPFWLLDCVDVHHSSWATISRAWSRAFEWTSSASKVISLSSVETQIVNKTSGTWLRVSDKYSFPLFSCLKLLRSFMFFLSTKQSFSSVYSNSF